MAYSIKANEKFYTFTYMLADVNGTLSEKGNISQNIQDKIIELKKRGVTPILISSDNRGTLSEIAHKLNIEYHIAKTEQEKADIAKKYPKEYTVAIGNARIDIGLFKNACLSIGVITSEGIHTDILNHVNVLFNKSEDALDFLLEENTFSSTMKK